jgi:putative spermidine/putrescine transport system permease protein
MATETALESTQQGASVGLGSKVRRFGPASWNSTLKSWLGLAPFLLFCLLFEILPAVIVLQESFADSATGAFTVNNYTQIIKQAQYWHSYRTSIEVSLTTALLGGLFGFLAAYGVSRLRTAWLRNMMIGFSSITANFAGVPLAFAFVATLGVTGFVTVKLHDWFNFDLYGAGFSLYEFWGLVLVYIYFQLPLMLLVMVPALNGLRPQWREAATNLGASSFTYWWRVALPILRPSLIAAMLLLFVNSFGAYATSYALAQGNINLVPIQIGFVLNGNVTIDTGLGNALAVGMMVILLVLVAFSVTLTRRTNRWEGR